MPRAALSQANRRALHALARRRAKNKNQERVNNATLHAGSPMYYYCEGCSEEMTLPESHTCAAPRYCSACERLHEKGLLQKKE